MKWLIELRYLSTSIDATHEDHDANTFSFTLTKMLQLGTGRLFTNLLVSENIAVTHRQQKLHIRNSSENQSAYVYFKSISKCFS